MKHLTNREEEIMEQFWDRGPLFINDILKALGDLKLHYNTVSTVVRGLEDKGFVDHEQFGNTYRYFPVISREDFSRMSLQNIVGKYLTIPMHRCFRCSSRRRKSLRRRSGS